MKKLLLIAAIAFLSQTAYAFSPLDQSIIEIRDIIGSPELRRYIPPYESIMDIRRVQNGYLISTNRTQLFVEVRYRLRAAKKGVQAEQEVQTEKKEYELQFQQPTQAK